MIVAEAGGKLGLADQPQLVNLLAALRTKHLECDYPTERFIPGAINDPHPPAAQLIQEPK